jgi:multiple sugar transport system permease protein
VPGLISAGIFAFTLSWNEFIDALTFVSDSEIKTVPVAVFYSFFVGYYVAGMTGAVNE